MRRCFIHIGTHKTGTLSLQHALNTWSQELQGFGFCYPRSGRPTMAPQGHHNIAWEISHDGRFRREFGAIDDLLNEIANSPYDVILSSEDFECSAHCVERFTAFIESLKSYRFTVKFIVYCRNQIDYAESLYLTMLLFALDIPFRDYLGEILETGKFCWRDWIFQFDYEELLTRLQSIDEVELVVRSYDALENESLIGDFLAILGLNYNDFAAVDNNRLNERWPVSAAIELFYQNCVRRPPLASEQAALATLFQSVGPRVYMNDQSRQALIDKFAGSNRRLSQTYKIPEFECMQPKSTRAMSGKGPPMEDIFSSGLRDLVEQTIRATREKESDLSR